MREQSRRRSLWLSLIHLVLISIAVSYVELILEKVIFGHTHETSNFKAEILQALRDFDPLNLGRVFVGGQESISDMVLRSEEYQTCLRQKGSDYAHFCEPNGRHAGSALCRTLEFGGSLPNFNEKCFEEIGARVSRTAETSEYGVFAFPGRLVRTIIALHLGSTPAERVVMFGQLLVGASLTTYLMSYFKVREIIPFCLIPPVFAVGIVIASVATAIPLQYVTLGVIDFATSVYVVLTFKAVEKGIEKTLDNSVGSFLHALIETKMRPHG
jgi:hypothetical protein